ncbi:MAG: exo-alpha-sialidase, partial [Gammaproteobacteria bacterium]|nr:exo-alpha-sialidase [Gammaproteobacteria bacterium]
MTRSFSICALICILAAPLAVHAQSWEGTGGPLGGLGYDVRIDPDDKQTMYLTDNFAGVLKSIDGGQTWVKKNTGIDVNSGPTGDEVNIFSLTIDQNNPSTLWAGSNSSSGAFGIFKSTNGGESWGRKVNGISADHTDFEDTSLVFRGFSIDPVDSNII